MARYDIDKLDTNFWNEPYTMSLGVFERFSYAYLRAQVANDRMYISLRQMAKDTGMTEEQCETFIAKFIAERKIPRLQIVEEMEG